MLNDLNFYAVPNPSLPPEEDTSPSGSYSSTSTVDNVEKLIINSPPSGILRLKVYPQDIAAGAGPQSIQYLYDPFPMFHGYIY